MVRGNKYLQNTKKVTSFILCVTIALMGLFNIPACAVTYPMMGEISSTNGEAKIYSLAGTTGHEAKPEDKNKSKLLITLKDGDKVKVLGEAVDGDGDKWYQINYGENFANTGYAVINKVVLKYEYEFDEDFEKNLQNFPESYRDALRALHSKYPNWKFIAANVNMTFEDAVNTQYNSEDYTKTRKYYTLSSAYGGDEWRDMRALLDEASNLWVQPEEGWTYASRTAIEYYMDPRNFLTENTIFVFAQQSYDSKTQTKDLLRKIITGSFLEKGYDVNEDDTISDDEKDAYLDDILYAAEQSKVSAYVIAAKIIGEQSETSPLITGKYPGYEGYYNFFNIGAYGTPKEELYKRGLTFAKNQIPPWDSRKASITGGAIWYEDGYIGVGQDTFYFMNFNLINKVYNHQYATNVRDAYNKADNLKDAFINNYEATVEFKIPVFTIMPETPEQNIPEPEPIIPKGDPNFDGDIDVVDLAIVKMHILEMNKLEKDSKNFKASDVNGDGEVDVVDLAAIKMDILEIRKIG